VIKVRVSGHSDDLVEVQFFNEAEEEVYGEEFPLTEDQMYLALSDGTVLRINFGSDWTIRKLRDGEGDTLIREVEGHKVVASDQDQEAIITIDADKVWVVAGPHFEKASIA
jgi:hypothetical protein